MSFWVYILRCADGSYYTGHTDSLEARMAAHEQGTFKCYTRSRRPVELAYCAGFPTRDEAFAAERRIKGWTRRKKEALIKEDWDTLVQLSKSKAARPSTGSEPAPYLIRG